MHELHETITRYQQQFEEYEYSHALEAVETFFWQIFCDNYLELVKDQFFNPDKYSQEERYATKHTLYEIGYALLQLYAPFLPHITETLYQTMFKEHVNIPSIHQTQLDATRWKYSFPESVNVVTQILIIVNHVRKLKSENHLSLKTELKELIVSVSDKALQKNLEHHNTLIAGIAKALSMSYRDDANDATTLTQAPEGLTAIVRV